MSKLRKAILIIGILVIAVAASLGTALALYATGTIKTDPIELEFKLKEPQEAKVYDGTPLKLSRVNFDDPYNSDIELSKGSLAKGHSIKVEFVGSQTDVGTSECDANIKIYDENGFNVTNEYSIKVIGATLKVVQKAISVELPAQKVVYNGSKVQFNEYKISEDSDGGLCLGHRIYGSANAELMNVGDTLPEDLTPLIFDAAGNDVTANYDIDFNLGDVEIEVIPRPVTVRPVSFEKVYDGVELIADEIEFVEGSLVEGQTVEYVINNGYENALTGVGDTKTEITSLKIFDTINGEKVEVTENYEFNLKEYSGRLKVTPRPLTIVGKSATFVYNGEEQSIKGDTKPESVEGLVEGEEVSSVVYAGSRTDVGVTVNRISEVSMRGADNYDINVIHGTLEITPFEMTYKTESSEKYYDGDVLFNENSECALANEGHKIVMAKDSKLPTIINVGSISNAYTVSVVDENNGDEDYTSNYAITYDYGTLTVKRLSVEVTLKNGEDNREKVNYDSKTHTPTLGNDDKNSDYFAVAPILNEGEVAPKCSLSYKDFELVAETRSMCDAGTYYYSVKFKDGTQEERQLYSNYELFVPESGALEIEPLPVSVTLKNYSGADAFTYSGSVVKVKEVDAIQNIALGDSAELPEDVELEKLLTKEDFKVVTREVKKSDDKTYTVPATEIIDAGENYVYTVKITDASQAKNFDVSIEGLEEDEEGVTLIVKKMSVTVTLADVEHTYSGEEQTVELDETFISMEKTTPLSADDDVTETGLPVGCLVVHYIKGDPINCGESTFDVMISDTKKKLQNNYELKIENADDEKKEFATLTVKQFVLEVTTDTCEFIYNGGWQYSGKFSIDALANEEHKITFAKNDEGNIVLPMVRDVNDTAINYFAVEIYKGVSNAEEDKVTDNYDIKYITGVLTVKPRPITVTTDTPAPHVYDGSNFSSLTAKITKGLKSEDGTEDLTGKFRARNASGCSIIEVGKEENVFTVDIVDVKTNQEITANFDISYEYGWLEVVPCPITVVTGYDGITKKPYDGTPLSNDSAMIKEDELAKKYVVRRAGAEPFSIVNAAKDVPNAFDCAIYNKSNVELTRNFDITYEYGTLTITPVQAKISLNNFKYEDAFSYGDESEKVDMTYDGKKKTFETKDAITGITIKNKKYEVKKSREEGKGIAFAESDFEIGYSSDIINVGRYVYTVKFTDEDFKNNFIFEDEEVEFSRAVYVTQKELKVKLKNFTGDDAFTFNNLLREIDIYKDNLDPVVKIFDGEEELEYDNPLLAVNELVAVYPEQLFNAGDYKYEVKIENEDFAKNFLLTGTVGNVEIKQFEVSVSLKDFTTEYSGEEFVFPANEAISIEYNTVNAETPLSSLIFPTDFTFAAIDGSSIKDAGTYHYEATFIDEINNRNFLINVITEDGYNATVEIEKARAKVSLKEVKLTFKNEVLKIDNASAIEIDGQDLLSVEDFDIAIIPNGGQTQLFKAGTYSYKATLTNENFELVDIYDSVKEDGTLTGGTVIVGKYEFTVTLTDLSKEYDGADYDFDYETIFVEFEDDVFAPEDLAIAYDDELADHSDADTYALKVVLIEDLEAIKGSVIIKTENGELTISKKSLVITTPTDEFEYDGGEHSAYADPELSGAVEGHYASVNELTVKKVVDVAATPYENTVEYTIWSKTVNEDGSETEKEVTGNYEIEYVNGTLTVTPRALTIKTGSASREYNGLPLSYGWIDETIGLLVGHTCTLPDDLPDQTDIGVKKNEFDVTIYDAGNADVTANYEVTCDPGDLTVTAVAIKVQFKEDVKVDYTGKDVNLSGKDVIGLITKVKNTLGAPAPMPEDFVVIFEGEAVNAGEYSFTVRIKSDCNPDLYDVQDATGKVTVNKLKVTVSLKDYEETYDGKIHTVKIDDAVKSIKAVVKNEGVEEKVDTGLLTAADLSVVYDYDMLLVNNYREKLAKDEVYGGDTVTVDDITYKVLTPDVYTYKVEVADPVMAENFDITVTGGEFKIKKRKLTFSVANVYMSKQEYDENYANEYSIDVTENVSVSTNTPLAEGDHLIINGAVAERTLLSYMTFYLNAFLDGEIELTHMDCYEFTNVNGDDAKSATVQLITY